MRLRVLSLLMFGWVLTSAATYAQGRLDLPAGDWGVSGPKSAAYIVVEPKTHRVYFRQLKADMVPLQAAGVYRVTSSKTGEILAKFTVDSLVAGGGDAKSVQMLGLNVRLNDVIPFTVRLHDGDGLTLTVFDGSFSPVFKVELKKSP